MIPHWAGLFGRVDERVTTVRKEVCQLRGDAGPCRGVAAPPGAILGLMTSPALESVRAAYGALNDGDADPLAHLFAPDTVWRGVERGFLWWRKAPS